MDFTASSVRREIIKIGASSGLGQDIKNALPVVAVMTPVTFGKNFLEEKMQSGIETSMKTRWGKLNKEFRGSFRSKSSPAWSRSKKVRHKIFKTMSIKQTGKPRFNNTFARSLGRGIGASTLGATTALLNIVLLSKALRK